MAVRVTFPDAEKIPSLVEYKVKTTEGDTIIVTEKLLADGEVLWVKFDYDDKEFLEKHKNQDKVTRTAKIADTKAELLSSILHGKRRRNRETRCLNSF